MTQAYVLPRDHRILLENERVRVLELHINPGEKTGMHARPPNMVYAFGSAWVRFSFPNADSREVEIQEGDTVAIGEYELDWQD